MTLEKTLSQGQLCLLLFLSLASGCLKKKHQHQQNRNCAFMQSNLIRSAGSSQTTPATLGSWSNENGEEGNTQGSFETLFVFADIFSLGLSWPVSQREPVTLTDSLSRAPPSPACKRKTKHPNQLLGGEVARKGLSQMPAESNYLLLTQVAAVAPRLKIKSEAGQWFGAEWQFLSY